MMQKVLLLGANGQVGRALAKELGPSALALTRSQLDLADTDQIVSRLHEIVGELGSQESGTASSECSPIAAVINAAAYTAVDRAESENELAQGINGLAPGEIARFCREIDVPMVHFSTDYVFNGNGDLPWTEDMPTDPLNFYGSSKLAGEKAVEGSGAKYFIFRTSWVFDEDGQNFVNTMLRLGKERSALKIVADQFGAPSYAGDLATATLQALAQVGRVSFERLAPWSRSLKFVRGDCRQQKKFDEIPSGVYHLCNDGVTTWYDFAKQIFSLARENEQSLKMESLDPIAASEFPTPAKRPHNSRLSTEKIRSTFGFYLRPWEEALKVCLHNKW